MGSARLTKAKLHVLPDHFRPSTQRLAAEQEPWLHVSRHCPGLTAGAPRTPWGVSWPLLV